MDPKAKHHPVPDNENLKAMEVLPDMDSCMQSAFFQHLLTCGQLDQPKLRDLLASFANTHALAEEESFHVIVPASISTESHRSRKTLPPFQVIDTSGIRIPFYV